MFPAFMLLRQSAIYWVACIFCITSVSCNTEKQIHPFIEEAKKIAQPGDLLLRAGTSYASENIRQLSLTDKTYSHVGIVVDQGGELLVCSIEPVDETSPTDSIRYEPFEKYLNPLQNSAFALYRYQISPEEKADLLERIKNYYRQGIVFDPVFIYETDDRMYCSEMISKAVDSATNGRIKLGRSYITDKSAINSLVRHFKKHKLTKEQIKERPVVMIDNVYRHPACSLVKKFEFKQWK